MKEPGAPTRGRCGVRDCDEAAYEVIPGEVCSSLYLALPGSRMEEAGWQEAHPANQGAPPTQGSRSRRVKLDLCVGTDMSEYRADSSSPGCFPFLIHQPSETAGTFSAFYLN